MNGSAVDSAEITYFLLERNQRVVLLRRDAITYILRESNGGNR